MSESNYISHEVEELKKAKEILTNEDGYSGGCSCVYCETMRDVVIPLIDEKLSTLVNDNGKLWLDKCPFCRSSEAVRFKHYDRGSGGVSIVCSLTSGGCGASSAIFSATESCTMEERAAAAWNKRAYREDHNGEITTLYKQINDMQDEIETLREMYHENYREF